MKKRIVGMIISAIMLISTLPMTVMADGQVSEKSIWGKDIYSDVADLGFYDNGEYRVLGFEVSGNCCVLRKNEWVRYDISDLMAGNYLLKISSAQTGIPLYDVFVGKEEPYVDGDGQTQIGIKDTTVLLNAAAVSSGSYTTYVTSTLGKITLDGEQDTIKLHNTTAYSTYFEKLELVRIPAFEISSFTTNLGADNGVVARGCDTLILNFSNSVSDLSSTSIRVMTANNKEISQAAVTGDAENQIKIYLKDSLSYNTEYKIIINDLKDSWGQTLTATQNFTSTDESIADGESTSRVDSKDKNGNKVVINGTILSSANVGISGRSAVLYVKVPGATDVIEADNTVSGTDGAVAFEYNFNNDDTSGDYQFIIGGEYIEEWGQGSVTVPFINQNLENDILQDFNNKTSVSDIVTALTAHAETLDIDLTGAQNSIADFDKVCNRFLNKSFTSFEAIVEHFNEAVVLEKVNQGVAASGIKELFEGADNCSTLGIDYGKWNLLNFRQKDRVAASVYADSEYADIPTLSEKINGYIDEVLLNANGVPSVGILDANTSVTAGQIADIPVSFDSAVDNLKGVKIELTYHDDATQIFELDDEVTFDTSLEDATVTTEREDNKIIINVEFETAASGIEDLLELSFSSAKVEADTYTLSVSGKVIYQLEATGEYNLTRGLAGDAKFDITIKKVPSKGRYDGGSGGGGYSSSNSGGISYPTQGNILPTSDEVIAEQEKNSKTFTDLDDVAWAEESILALADKGVVQGRTENEFVPNGDVTRAEFCKMIVLALDIYNEAAKCEFTDTDSSKWHYSYIASAAEAGLISGYENGSFGADKVITREDMAVIIRRILKDVTVSEETELFSDDSTISDYAKEAVYILKEQDIISGVGDNMFAPKTTVSRAMAAKVIYTVSE